MPRKGDNACLHLWLNDQKVEYEVKTVIIYDVKHNSRLIQALPSQVVGSHWHSYSSGGKGGTDVGSRTLVCPFSDLGPD